MARSKDKAKPAQIIDAAFAVFGEIGYEATLIKDIAEHAGISTGTIYTYFDDKKDLFRAAAQVGWDRFLAEIRTIVDSRAPLAARLQTFGKRDSRPSSALFPSCAACSSNPAR